MKEKSDKAKVKERALVPPEFLTELMSLAAVFVKSGMFPDLKTQAQGVVKILAGKELGLAPLESLTNIYIVNGKVALQAKIIGGLIKKSPKYDYEIKSLSDEECSITFYSLDVEGKRKEEGVSTFTKADAARAGVINKDSYKSYPRNMYFARALSNGNRWYCPDVSCGYHVQEELEDIPETTSLVTINKEGKVENGKVVKENGETTVE